jgi:hypothetical protein
VRPGSSLLWLWLSLLAAVAAGPALAQAQAEGAGGEEAALAAPHLAWSVEVKTAYRDSEDKSFRVPFDFSALGAPGPVFLRTVDPGSSIEVPAATLFLDADWGPSLLGHVKIDFVDLYDRNPTSTDHTVDLDEAWIRFGRQSDPGMVPEHAGGYIKVGKMAKLERQNDRHLESYGLVSTAFNRFEDLGVELGFDLGRHLYVKGTYTRGNPVFIRSPDALAGDNGTPDSVARPPHPALNRGIPILYDAEIEDTGSGGHEETGAALGFRLANEDATRRLDLLVFGYQ